jgi:hypothetical protein
VSDLLPLRNNAGRNQQAGLFAAGGKICPASLARACACMYWATAFIGGKMRQSFPASLVIKWLFPRS